MEFQICNVPEPISSTMWVFLHQCPLVPSHPSDCLLNRHTFQLIYCRFLIGFLSCSVADSVVYISATYITHIYHLLLRASASIPVTSCLSISSKCPMISFPSTSKFYHVESMGPSVALFWYVVFLSPVTLYTKDMWLSSICPTSSDFLHFLWCSIIPPKLQQIPEEMMKSRNDWKMPYLLIELPS